MNADNATPAPDATPGAVPSMSDYLGTTRTPAPPAAKFSKEGDSVAGTVEGVAWCPDLEFHTKEQKRDRDGNPLMILRVDLSTPEGLVAVWVGGSRRVGSGSVRDAVRAAVRAAGATEIAVGARLRVTQGKTAPNSLGTGFMKTYTASYRAPEEAGRRDAGSGIAPSRK